MSFPLEMVLETLEREVSTYQVPVVDLIATQTRDPFKVLVATILSARTRDEVTAAASRRLFARADSPESLARLPVEVDVASEFRYRDPVLEPDSMAVIISQSGETADTLAALRECKERGVRTIGIVNVVGSSIAREADATLYTWAGPEIAVATTKAYSTQLAACYLLAVEFARVRGKIEEEKYAERAGPG